MKKILIIVLSATLSVPMHAQCHPVRTEDFSDFDPADKEGIDQIAIRAVNTTVLNNMLVEGTIHIKGNLIIEGIITGTLSGNGGGNQLFGPASSTLNAAARFGNTTGNSIIDSIIIIDDTNNVTGSLSVSTQSLLTTSTVTVSARLINNSLTCIQGIEFANITDGGSFAATTTTALAIFSLSGTISSFTITFPPSPLNGQFFTMLNSSGDDLNGIVMTTSDGSTIINAVTSLTGSTITRPGTTYQFYAPNNAWYLAIP